MRAVDRMKAVQYIKKLGFISILLLASVVYGNICLVNVKTGKKRTVSRGEKFLEEICQVDYKSGNFSYLVRHGSEFVLKMGNVDKPKVEVRALSIPLKSITHYWGGCWWHYAMSPDGKSLAYYDDSNGKIVVTQTTTKAQPVPIGVLGIKSFVSLRFFDWINDDELVLGIDDRVEGLRGLYSVNINTKKCVELLITSSISHGCKINQERSMLAFKIDKIPGTNSIVVFDLNKKRITTGFPVNDLSSRPIAWCKSKNILYFKDENALWAYDNNDGIKSKLCSLEERTFMLDFDGKTLAYTYFPGITREDVKRSKILLVKDVESSVVKAIRGVQPHGKCFWIKNSEYLLVDDW